jgi:hypothetical protein
VHVEKGSKIELQSNGDCSPNIIGGSNTVNCGPFLPKVAWKPLASSPYPKQPVVNPQAYATLSVDRLMENAKFAVVCDRPCNALLGGVTIDGFYEVLHTFAGGNDGAEPQGDLMLGSDGAIYGTTLYGGVMDNCSNLGCGVIFKYTP